MARTQLKQYLDTVTLTVDEVDDMAAAMQDVLKYGIIELDDNTLATRLSIGAALAGILFNLTRKASIAVGVVGLALSLQTSLRDELEKNIRIAIDDLHDTRRFMKRNRYSKVKMEFPFMDYKEIRLVTGKGEAIRVLGDDGWESL